MAKKQESGGGCLVGGILVLLVLGWAAQNPAQAGLIVTAAVAAVAAIWWWRRDQARQRLERLVAAAPGSIVPKTGSIEVDAVTFSETRNDASLEVVGEQYYPSAMAGFKRAIGSGSGKALLGRDPTNQFDPNAIVVYAWVDGGRVSPVGHLTREDAVAYLPIFTFLAGKVISCEAAVAPRRGGGGTDGVVLHLGTPGELIAELWADAHPAPEDHPWRDKTVAFSGFGVSLAGVTLDAQGQTLLARLSGCLPARSVTKKVSACVSVNPRDGSANLLKARDYGIPIVGERDFWVQLGVDPSAMADGLGRWAQPERRGWAR